MDKIIIRNSCIPDTILVFDLAKWAYKKMIEERTFFKWLLNYRQSNDIDKIIRLYDLDLIISEYYDINNNYIKLADLDIDTINNFIKMFSIEIMNRNKIKHNK